MSRYVRRFIHSYCRPYWYYHINFTVICSTAQQHWHVSITASIHLLPENGDEASRNDEDKGEDVKRDIFFRFLLMFYASNFLSHPTQWNSVDSTVNGLPRSHSLHAQQFADESFFIFAITHDNIIKYYAHYAHIHVCNVLWHTYTILLCREHVKLCELCASANHPDGE